MWTLRDLWHMIDPQAAEEWRKRQMEQMFKNKPAPTDSLIDLLYQKRDLIQNNPLMQKDDGRTDQQLYGNGMNFGYNLMKQGGYPFKGGTL